MNNAVEILFRDEHLVAVNKPPGLSVTADRSGKVNLTQLLRRQLPDVQEFRLVHRLDKDTSGVMVLAVDVLAQRVLSRAFAGGQAAKTYLALVSGSVSTPRGRISVPLAHSPKDPRKMRIDPRRGKQAVTEYELLADFGSLALLAVRPRTGRTHQIRMHLAYANLPLAIDPLYGSAGPILLSDFKAEYRRKGKEAESPLIDRLTLHSYSLQLPDTQITDGLTIIARPERKFAAAIKMLTKHGPNGPAAFVRPDLLDIILTGRPLPGI